MKRNNFLATLGLTFSLAAGLSASAFAASSAPVKPILSSDDCVKCHEKQPADISSAGEGHKSITCQDCHAGHRPSAKNNIPQCGQCHQEKKHYKIKGCLSCHGNPHTPLKIVIPSNTTDVCLTCHDKQIAQLRENKSKHSAFACASCHGSTHRHKPECTMCHKPHASDMVASDCNKCHKAHMPKVVTYGADVSSTLCAACHKRAFDLVAATPSKHHGKNCAECHQSKHKMIPECQSCHGSPHPAGIMRKFPKCGECHKIAHDLNNWPDAAKAKEAAPAKAAPKIKAKAKKGKAPHKTDEEN